MKNMVKLFGIIAIVAVIGLGMTACDDGSEDDNGGGGPGVTVTFSIDKVDARTFTITQEGARGWDRNAGIDDPLGTVRGWLFDADHRTVTATAAGDGAVSTPSVSGTFAFTITSDTLLTIALRDFYSSVSGTIALNTNTQAFEVVVDVDHNKENTFLINPAKASITF